MRRTRIAPMVMAAALLAGCAGDRLRAMKLAALAARETAETAYVTVRVQYLLGRVDEATMRQARELYAAWAMAQEAWLSALAAIEAGKGDEALAAIHRARAEEAARRLKTLADACRAAPTTRPASG